MAVLRSVVGRIAAVVRGAAAVYVVVQVAIWHDYYAAHPWYLAGPLAAVAWGAAAAVYRRRHRPAWPLIVLDSSFYAGLAISSGMCVPPDMRGVTGNWLYIVLASQVVVAVWFAPRVPAVLLSLVPEAAYAGMTAAPIDLAAVDDHPIILDSIAGWVSGPDSGVRVIATAATVDDLLAGPGRDAHVILLDLDLGDGTTAERNVAMIRAAGPAVLVLAASDKPVSVRDAIRAGALGYVLKNEETSGVRAAIKAMAAGKDWVSPRLAYIFATDDAPDRPILSAQETRALQLYATGMPMKSVARRMCISEETARQYVGRVREKYARAGRAAPTKLDLYYRAVEDGHLPPHP
jgi:DNA-binding NarL/FixJ family response regulator